MALLEPMFVGPVALFASRELEIDTTPLDEYLVQHGIPRWYPAIAGDHLEFRLAVGRMRDWPIDGWGIPIPPQGPTMPLPAAAVILIPGLAFDRTGRRLGYGRGYYDKALVDCTKPIQIGLALPEQILPEVPTEAHDRRIPFLAIPGLGLLTCQ